MRFAPVCRAAMMLAATQFVLSSSPLRSQIRVGRSANTAQPAAAPATATKTDRLVTPHKRHVAKHHARSKFAKHARHHNKFVSHKRHGKFVKAHIRHGKFVKAHKAHGKIVKVSKTQKHTIAKKVRTSAK